MDTIQWILAHSLDQYIVAAVGANWLTLFLVLKIAKVIAKRTKVTWDDDIVNALDKVRSSIRGGKPINGNGKKEPIPLVNVRPDSAT